MRKSRFVNFIFLASLSLATLTACGGKGIENLEATCESLRTKMKPLENIGLLDRKLYYDGDSVAMLLGWETRADNKKFILQTFPFMQNYTVEGIQNGDYEKGLNEYQIQTALHLFASTPNPIEISEEEKKKIEVSSNPYEEVIEPKVVRVIGDSYSEDGCAGLDSNKNVDYELQVTELYQDAQEAAGYSFDHLLGILLCERDGKIDDTKCDSEDFKDTYVATSNEPTAEELEILAEREQNSQSGNQGSSGSSGYSNVSAGQVCNSFGAVVITENYGELTCKFVVVGRLRTLLWMRS
jgi:hypothetical protein